MDVKPIVDFSVYSMVFVCNLLWCQALNHSLGLSGCTIFISTTNWEDIVARSFTVKSENIGTQKGTDKIPQVRDIIDIRQSRSDEDISNTSFFICRQSKANEMVAKELTYIFPSVVGWSDFTVG